ncbi:hypothetical protein [Candidatus Thiodictyon syntrophicum]|jgi:hypothetical protein|uniref:PEP-CTERM protein-sorting domain-containing protein n=1 Tax=Candidatus Thiodictyon syntrophicum TaxID=1166950 RepID=A0A2K8UDZ1_9GAMM|nr:hypothetical protein [Candidatus Thiodictyon syntrophicum]AUB83782.1 hypothetical protein THSYN_24385 [Candidatus Thiodictyon syntrophicum]
MAKSFARTLAAGLAMLGVFGSGAAVATATISLTPGGPLTYNTSQSNQTLSLDFSVSLGAGATVDDVMVQFDNFVAYDPNVLKYKTASPITFGPALSSLSGTPPRPSLNALINANYTSLGTLDPSITGIGTPVAESGYYDGSLRVQMVIDQQGTFDIADLFAAQGPGPSLLFTIVFDVVTTQIGNSAIILLNDTSFVPDIAPPTYDSKYWDEGEKTPFYPTSNVVQVIVTDAPAPAPLALIAAGLIAMAARRRAR